MQVGTRISQARVSSGCCAKMCLDLGDGRGELLVLRRRVHPGRQGLIGPIGMPDAAIKPESAGEVFPIGAGEFEI